MRERHRRHALFERLRQTSYLKTLPQAEIEALCERAILRTYHRGERVVNEGAEPSAFYLIGEGMVKVGRKVGSMEHIRAYLSAGDFFGDLELIYRTPHAATVTAMSTLELIELPAETFLALKARHEKLGDDLRRLKREANALLQQEQQALPGLVQLGDRLGVAQSLLIIDLDECVRCGNCAWSCEQTHGTSRIVRRGETLTRTRPGHATPTSSLLPNSCQHCSDAACMSGCPTGAISRDLDGEVFIRSAICIGCSDCAKRCPWGNISMMALPEGGPHRATAVKCDNCRDYTVSACAFNCPTGALKRVDPVVHFPELARLLKREPVPTPPDHRIRNTLLLLGLFPGLPLLAAVAYGMIHRLELRGGSAFGLACGVGGLLLMAGAVAYGGRKRLIRTVMKLYPKRGSTRESDDVGRLQKSKGGFAVELRRWLLTHIAFGGAAFLLIVMHAGLMPHALLTSMLLALFAFVIASGIFGGWVYRALPRLLTEIEGTPRLIEDIGEETDDLAQQRAELAQGRPPAFHSLVETMRRDLSAHRWTTQIVLKRLPEPPFVRAIKEKYRPEVLKLGSEHRLAMEQVLEGLCRERHLAAQRVLHRAMRVWLTPHILATVAMGLLLILHLVQVVWY
jgi:Fe-S-cluster-containing dehydrogenase component